MPYLIGANHCVAGTWRCWYWALHDMTISCNVVHKPPVDFTVWIIRRGNDLIGWWNSCGAAASVAVFSFVYKKWNVKLSFTLWLIFFSPFFNSRQIARPSSARPAPPRVKRQESYTDASPAERWLHHSYSLMFLMFRLCCVTSFFA